MNKPIDLSIYEAREEIVNAINKTELPLSIVSMILNGLLSEVNNQLSANITKQRKEFDESKTQEVI